MAIGGRVYGPLRSCMLTAMKRTPGSRPSTPRSRRLSYTTTSMKRRATWNYSKIGAFVVVAPLPPPPSKVTYCFVAMVFLVLTSNLDTRSSSFRRLLLACSVQASCQMTGVSVRPDPLCSVYTPKTRSCKKLIRASGHPILQCRHLRPGRHKWARDAQIPGHQLHFGPDRAGKLCLVHRQGRQTVVSDRRQPDQLAHVHDRHHPDCPVRYHLKLCWLGVHC